MSLYVFAAVSFVFFNDEYTFPDHENDCTTNIQAVQGCALL